MQLGDQIAVELQVGRLVEELRDRVEPLELGGEPVTLVVVLARVLEPEDLSDVVRYVQLNVERGVAGEKLLLVLPSHFKELAEKIFYHLQSILTL